MVCDDPTAPLTPSPGSGVHAAAPDFGRLGCRSSAPGDGDRSDDRECLVTSTQYLRAFARFLWLIVLCAVLGLVAALIVDATSKPTYTSSASIVLSPTKAAGLTAAETYQATLLAQQRMTTYAGVAAGSTIANAVEAQLDLPRDEQLEDRIKMSVPPGSAVMNIVVTDSNSHQAQLMASSAETALVETINELESARGRGPALLRAKVLNSGVTAAPVAGPPEWRNPVIGLVGGLLVGLALAALAGGLDPRLRETSTVSDVLRAPVLGVLPIDRPRRFSRRHRAPLDDAIQELRSSLFFLRPTADQPLIIAVTSPHSLEQVLPVTWSLAVALAETDARVLLVDADLQQDRSLPIHSSEIEHRSLADLLAGSGASDDLIVHDPMSGVDLIAAGGRPEDSADLLHSQHFAIFLEGVAAQYDFVLVVAPATTAGTDALAVAARCHGVLVATVQGRTRKQQLTTARHALERVGSRTLGAVVLA